MSILVLVLENTLGCLSCGRLWDQSENVAEGDSCYSDDCPGNDHEAATALGFQSVEEMNKHEVWLYKNGIREYVQWVNSRFDFD